ncbi:type IV secretory system conjugative DNA transfer family protein [Pseudotenacibaculum haliotis]|uniref:Type IV secretory system conjugative DNA transfer family protein n=1 Tax=Pseudotenacibaculum haliotis TaxID=1862138 RepID=A0ABW5LPX3_9FLAO
MRLSPEISYFARVDFRDDNRLFGILQRDRMMGMYILGKIGSGKTNLIKILVYQDLIHNRGLYLSDVNGDLIRDVLKLVPKHRKKDVIYLNPDDPHCEWGYNPLRKVSYPKRALIASSLLETFKKTWGGQSWGVRLEYILRNLILASLDQEHSNLEDIPRLLLDEPYRNTCAKRVINPHVKKFLLEELPKYGKSDILPVINKVSSFLSIPFLRKVLVENQQQLSLRYAMDNRKIVLVNLSKGSLGADGAYLLGSLLLTALSSSAFSRIDIPIEKRVPFHVFLDEFHNYTTGSVVGMLSEHRKFAVGYTLAHQYISQLSTQVRDAVLGNIGTIVCFKLGLSDAKHMEKEFYPIFSASDFVELEHYHVYLRLLVRGRVSDAFSAKTVTTDELKTI